MQRVRNGQHGYLPYTDHPRHTDARDCLPTQIRPPITAMVAGTAPALYRCGTTEVRVAVVVSLRQASRDAVHGVKLRTKVDPRQAYSCGEYLLSCT